MAHGKRAVYAPVNVLKPVAPNVWIADGGPLWLAAMPVPLRMTVLGLQDGMMLHSPIPWCAPLQQEIQRLGAIRHLIAPNPFHWSFVQEWKSRCPEALVWAAESTGTRRAVRRSGLTIDRELSDVPPPEWSDELDQVVIRARYLIREVAFLHRVTRTLILADLVVNLERGKLPWFVREGVSMLGSMAPDGRAPLYSRILFRLNGDEAARCAARLIDFAPERVIFSHGHWFDRDGAARLSRSLRWLTGSG